MEALSEPVPEGIHVTSCREARVLAAFLDREFDGAPGLAREFPLLVGTGNLARCVVAECGGEIVAHAAWRPLDLRSDGGVLRAAGVGLVTTGRAWRGRGLASALVERCVCEARGSGADLALLFGTPRELYRRLGFVPAGRERMTRLGPGETDLDARRGGPEDAAALRPLLARHPLGVERSVAEFEALLGIPGTHLRVLERGGRASAYCVQGKGRDLQGIVHEWAGEPEPVARLLEGSGAAWVLSPADVDPPVRGEHTSGTLAQIKVLDPQRLGSDDPVELFGDASTPARRPLYLWGLDSV